MAVSRLVYTHLINDQRNEIAPSCLRRHGIEQLNGPRAMEVHVILQPARQRPCRNLLCCRLMLAQALPVYSQRTTHL